MGSSPGAIAANYYQGARSEYLAQYVFSMFGTAMHVPHEVDTGFDLACTLTRTAGGRGEPYAYYSVQVKSTDLSEDLRVYAHKGNTAVSHMPNRTICVYGRGRSPDRTAA